MIKAQQMVIRRMPQIIVKYNLGGIDGLCLITPTIHTDNRGWLMESFNERELSEAGLNLHFVQDIQSLSHKGALRGLHFQKQFPQGKLVRCITGSLFDVAVDLRHDSSTFGKWHGVILSAENNLQFYMPPGFAHGFLALEENTTFFAKVTDYQHKGDAYGIAWNDPDIGIKWPLHLLGGAELIMTEADKNKPSLNSLQWSVLNGQ